LAIVPDVKDWTWVLRRPCPECGFDTRTVAREQVAGLIRANAGSWRRILAERGEPELRARPDALTWSPLEYACHVRDVFSLFDVRLGLMIDTDDPLYPNWDQDATAVEQDYRGQDPSRVSDQLGAAAHRLADHFAAVSATGWSRPGRRSDGATFTVETFARYLVHDPVHHLHDVGGVEPRG
jgi:DinB superfamily